MQARRPARSTSIALLFVLAMTACASDEAREPAPSESLQEGGSDPTIDAEDAEGLPDPEALQDEQSPGDTLALATATSEEYGEYLVDGEGLSVYVFVEDPPGESTCTGECVEQWPIVSTAGEPEIGEGVDPDLVGTIDREDPAEADLRQVTYRDRPLYLYVLDQQPGETTGQGEDGVWFLMAPDGTTIRE